MVQLNIPKFKNEKYVAYWVMLNGRAEPQSGVLLKDLNKIFSTMDYNDVAEYLGISLSKCRAFIKEACSLGVMISSSYDTGGQIRYNFHFTQPYIIREVGLYDEE